MTVHVLVIPRGLYDVPSVPNQGIFECHQVAALRAAGLQMGVLSGGVITTRHLGRRFPYTHQELTGDVPVYRAYRRAYLPARWEDPIRAADRTYRKLKPLLRQYMDDHGRPDVVHAHNLASGGLVARLIKLDTGIPYVVTEHTGTYVADLGATERDADLLAVAAADASAVVAVGSHLAAALRGALGGCTPVSVGVVPNVVDLRLLNCSLKGLQGPFTVAGLGNLIPTKNFALLVSAFARADLPSNSELLIGGEGPQARRIGEVARSLGIEDRVHLTGYMGRDQVMQLLQRADVFAHPSDSESFGVVLIEAMAVGVPIVATASSGPQDIVTPDIGLLTPVGDVQGFADGLSEMHTRRSEFNAERIRAACRDRFGPEAFASRMLGIYTGALT